MATEQRIVSKKVALAESLTELIDRNPTKSALVLLSVILTPWFFEDFVSPAMGFACFELAPQIWKLAREWLTEPVLFLIVNFVMLSIWITSGSMSCAEDEVEGKWTKKQMNPVPFRSEYFSSIVAGSSHLPSRPHTITEHMSPTPPLRFRQFSREKRCLSSPRSDITREILPGSSVFTTFSSKQKRAPLALLPEIQSEQTCQTLQQSSSYDCESDQLPRTMKCVQPQASSHNDANVSRTKSPESNRLQRRNSELERRPVEQIKHESVNIHSENKRPSRRFSRHKKSTLKSYSEKSATFEQSDSFVQNHIAYAEGTTSSVIVSDVSVSANSIESSEQSGLRDPLVIEKDELNERIEAFFSKFREQLRQDSLRWN